MRKKPSDLVLYSSEELSDEQKERIENASRYELDELLFHKHRKIRIATVILRSRDVNIHQYERLLRDKYWKVRLAAFILRRFIPRVPQYEALLSDPHSEVRSAVVIASKEWPELIELALERQLRLQHQSLKIRHQDVCVDQTNLEAL